MHDFQEDLDVIANIDSVPTILDVVCRTTGMGFAAIARVTEDRWVACGVRDEIAFGLPPGGELKVETTICNEIRDHRSVVVIDNVAEDPTYCSHPTPAMYGLQSYISLPIILKDGRFFGTLCAIDPKPHKLNTPAILGTFKLFAELIAFHLDAHQELAASRASLATEVQTGETREQFIAVLGHDLRNPLASVEAGLRLQDRTEDLPKIRSLTAMMRASVGRMSDLIDDVLDFARGRLGGGLALERQVYGDLEQTLALVVTELRTAHPDREIVSEIHIGGKVDCDNARIAQMLSNLVGNALTHGAVDMPVIVRAHEESQVFKLSVSNGGEAILPAVIGELFKPFVRASSKPSQQGLGLGLYICAEIAKAHGGTLEVTSTPEETCFTFRMPL
ncbi:histidine kinase [Bosea sp. Root381]|uniref:GAF domain-containing sensor histidine kinase n=1 Tax=Bosea sp. Root381 TaxID=1736524 RepID=UPI000701B10F|nr:GAF domain-containing sensor histidine kinase [Bosea sp. Root381]KRE00643.1 histidine kinase [Bosea sp. Root381]